MTQKGTLLSLLILLQFLFSCGNDQSKPAAKKPVAAIVKKEAPAPYKPLLESLALLKQDPLLKNADLGYMIVDDGIRLPGKTTHEASFNPQNICYRSST